MRHDESDARTPLPATIDEFFRDGEVVTFLRSVVLANGWGHRQDVDDVVQGACIRLMNAWGKLQDVEHARRFALLAARHAALDVIKARRTETESRLAALWTPETFDPVDEVADHIAVREALRGLPRDQAEALLLLAARQLTYDEAAHALGVSVGRFKGLLQRARENLRNSLGDLPAAFVLGWRPRRVAAPTMTAPALVAAAALCLSVARAPALDGVPPSPGRSAAAPADERVAAAGSGEPVVPVVGPDVTSTTTRVPKQLPAGDGAHPQPRRLDLPKPPVPASACTGDVCVGGDTQDGDWLCIEGIERTCAKQDRVAVCEVIHDNELVTCERHGDPAWLVPPPP